MDQNWLMVTALWIPVAKPASALSSFSYFGQRQLHWAFYHASNLTSKRTTHSVHLVCTKWTRLEIFCMESMIHKSWKQSLVSSPHASIFWTLLLQCHIYKNHYTAFLHWRFASWLPSQSMSQTQRAWKAKSAANSH